MIDTLARAELRNRLRAPACDVDNNGVLATPSSEGDADGAGAPLRAGMTVDKNGVLATPPGRGLQDGASSLTGAAADVDNNGVLATPSSEGDADGAGAPSRAGVTVGNNGVLATPAGRGLQDGARPSTGTAAFVDESGVLAAPPGPVGDGSHAAADRDAGVDNAGVLATPPRSRARSSRPSLPALRAEVLLGLIHRAVTDPTFPTSHGKRRIDTQVVITLDTLLGLRQDPASINGRPVPGPIARELANASSSLRRLVTDPVGGHLLDYGDAYPVPQPLAEFVLARDGECRVPHCHVRATVSDLELPYYSLRS